MAHLLRSWLNQRIDRGVAEAALSSSELGAFLVRASLTQPGDYVISVMCSGGVEHHVIKHANNVMVTRSGVKLDGLDKLIEYYSQTDDGLPVLLGRAVDPLDPNPTPIPPPRPTPSARPPPTPTPSPRPTPSARPPPIPHARDSPAPARPPRRPNKSKGVYSTIVHVEPALKQCEVPRTALQVIDEIGNGQFGCVFKAWMPMHKTFVAVKTCKDLATAEDKNDFMAEAMLLHRFKHPNVLGLRAVVMATLPWQIVIDFMPYGDLRAVLKKARKFKVAVQEREKLTFASQVAAGMDYLGRLSYVHRDLAARNVLLGENSEVKVADFGLSRQLADDGAYTLVRTRLMLPIKWMAPECATDRIFTQRTDVWAFGVLLWEIASLGKTPYKKRPIQNLIVEIYEGYRMPPPADCNAAVYNVMQKCWDLDPSARPTFASLSTQLAGMMAGPVQRNFGEVVRLAAAAGDGGDGGDGGGGSRAADQFEVPVEDLCFIKDLGEGAYGQVMLMEVTSGRLSATPDSTDRVLIAAKMLKADATDAHRAAFDKEMAIMTESDFRHPNVIGLVGICTQTEPFLILLEYMDIGDLQMYLEAKAEQNPGANGLPVLETLTISEQIAHGCVHLVSKNVVHRDLATRNVLIGSGPVAKICDFGLGRQLDNGSEAYYQIEGSGCLPLRWMAPESVMYQKYTAASDMWSFGVTVWEIVMDADLPYRGYDSLALANCFGMEQLPSLVCKSTASPVLAEVIAKAMQPTIDMRPTFQAVWEMISDARKAMEASAGPADATATDDAEEGFRNGNGPRGDGRGGRRGDGLPPPPIPASRRPSKREAPFADGEHAGASSDSGSEEVVKTGWITKQGGGKSVFGKTSWKTRWFVLRADGVLSYYRDNSSEKCLGSFSLRTVQGMHTIVFKGHARECSFAVATEERMYAFVAETGGQRTAWMAAIQPFCSNVP